MDIYFMRVTAKFDIFCHSTPIEWIVLTKNTKGNFHPTKQKKKKVSKTKGCKKTFSIGVTIENHQKK